MRLTWRKQVPIHQHLKHRPGRRELWMATWGVLLLVYGLYKFAVLNG